MATTDNKPGFYTHTWRRPMQPAGGRSLVDEYTSIGMNVVRVKLPDSGYVEITALAAGVEIRVHSDLSRLTVVPIVANVVRVVAAPEPPA